MSLQRFADWLDETPISTAIKSNFWFIPSVQAVHILAVCLVFSGSVFILLRSWNVLGLDWTPGQWTRRLYPSLWWSLLVLLLTGMLMVVGEPTRELPNPAFQLKMVCLVMVTPLTFWLTRRLCKVEGGDAAPLVRGLTIVVVALWLAMIFAGRWIAYV
jgi:hypothetical protein